MVIVISEYVGHSVLDFIDYAIIIVIIIIIYYLFKLLFHGDHKHLPDQNPWDWLRNNRERAQQALQQQAQTQATNQQTPGATQPTTPATPSTPTPQQPTITPTQPTTRQTSPRPRRPRQPKSINTHLTDVGDRIKEVIKALNNGNTNKVIKKLELVRRSLGKADTSPALDTLVQGIPFQGDANKIKSEISNLRKRFGNIKPFRRIDITSRTLTSFDLSAPTLEIREIMNKIGDLVIDVNNHLHMNP
jgi:hypothetical protein